MNIVEQAKQLIKKMPEPPKQLIASIEAYERLEQELHGVIAEIKERELVVDGILVELDPNLRGNIIYCLTAEALAERHEA